MFPLPGYATAMNQYQQLMCCPWLICNNNQENFCIHFRPASSILLESGRGCKWKIKWLMKEEVASYKKVTPNYKVSENLNALCEESRSFPCKKEVSRKGAK